MKTYPLLMTFGVLADQQCCHAALSRIVFNSRLGLHFTVSSQVEQPPRKIISLRFAAAKLMGCFSNLVICTLQCAAKPIAPEKEQEKKKGKGKEKEKENAKKTVASREVFH